jgi:hypothetical protein
LIEYSKNSYGNIGVRYLDLKMMPAVLQVIPLEEKADGWEGDDAPSALVWKYTISRKRAGASSKRLCLKNWYTVCILIKLLF